MKKYIFEDGTEFRGIVIKEPKGFSGYREILIDESLNRHVMDDMPELERVTFVRNIDKELRDAFESLKKANNNKVIREQEIDNEIEKLREEKRELSYKNKQASEQLEVVYVAKTGIYTQENFNVKLSNKIKNHLQKYSGVSHGITTVSSDVHVYQNNINITIPVDIIRHPQEGDWDLYLEYDNTLHSYGENMTSEVVRLSGRIGFNYDKLIKNKDNPDSLKLNSVKCCTSVGDKIATLDANIYLEYKEEELNDNYLDVIMKEINELL